jgi:hypothetical protein
MRTIKAIEVLGYGQGERLPELQKPPVEETGAHQSNIQNYWGDEG